MVVVHEFGVGDLIGPGTRVGPAEDLKVCFYFLIDMFSFSIGLGVIDSGEGKIIVKEFSELLGKGGGKLWAMIRDNFII